MTLPPVCEEKSKAVEDGASAPDLVSADDVIRVLEEMKPSGPKYPHDDAYMVGHGNFVQGFGNAKHKAVIAVKELAKEATS